MCWRRKSKIMLNNYAVNLFKGWFCQVSRQSVLFTMKCKVWQ